MTRILMHVDGALAVRLDIDPDTLDCVLAGEDFPVAQAFRARATDMPDLEVDQDIHAGSLLGSEARLADEGQSVELALSCGTTTIFTVRREAGLRIARGDTGIHDIDSTPILQMLTETQRHFLARPPRA